MAQNLCGYSKEEICNALHIIKKICEKNNCPICPFSYGDGECKIQDDVPSNLEIESEKNIWRAIK